MAAKASPKSSRKEPVAPRREAASKRKLAVAAPSAPVPVQLPLEDRVRILEERLEKVAKTDPEFRQAYRESLDMSWIYHDSALEGTVYTSHELKGAVDPGAPLATDSSIQPVCEEIRRHREALDFIRDYAVNKKRQPV